MPYAFEMRMGLTSKVPTKHEIKNEETIFIILESISKVDQERVVDLHRGVRKWTRYMERCRTSSSNRRS